MDDDIRGELLLDIDVCRYGCSLWACAKLWLSVKFTKGLSAYCTVYIG